MVKTTPPTDLTTETAGRTKEEKKEKENERKRQQKDRKAARRELQNSTATLTSTAVPSPVSSSQAPPVASPPHSTIDIPATVSSPPRQFSYEYYGHVPAPEPLVQVTTSRPDLLHARSAHVPPAVRTAHSAGWMPSIPQGVIDDFAASFTPEEQDFVAGHPVDGILDDLISLALRAAWNAGWKAGRETGTLAGKEDGRAEGIAVGRRLELEEVRTTPPPIAREYTETEIQTDAAAFIILPQESSPPLTVAEEPILPSAAPIPRDLSALQTGSPRPFGSLQRRLARSRRPLRQKKSVIPPSHPIITRRHPRGISHGKPVTTTPVSSPPPRHAPPPHRVLDWDRDPLLSDLARALGALGWVRGFG
ncbi:hypothetical protein DFH09DRAFT_1277400 [Mycena vulgaris]|nr:hypothetical protein DFH09DRAFT_1277400 [Mycena vulgaris]